MINSSIKFIYSDFAKYESDEPIFYDLREHPAIIDLKNNFNIIIREVSPYINGEIEVNANNPNAPNVNYPNTWKHLYFMNYMLEYPTAKKLFPLTYSLIKKHPEITLAGVASLEGGGKLLPHSGETNAIIRCHLGLKIPGTLPDCGIRVKNQYRQWAEGDVICFNDAFNHEAWNLTNEKRFILLFDIMRPEFIGEQKKVCAYALSIASVRFFAEKIGLDKALSLWVRKCFILPTFMLWWIYLVVQALCLSLQNNFTK